MKGPKSLFLQKNRCQGCELCVIACPTGVLEMSDEINMRAARVPRVKEGKERSCILCQRCEFACPAWAIYLVDEQPEAASPETGENAENAENGKAEPA